MEQALRHLNDGPESFAQPLLPYSVPRLVVYRNGRSQLDNGNCHAPRQLALLLRPRAGEDRELQAQRGRRAERRRRARSRSAKARLASSR